MSDLQRGHLFGFGSGSWDDALALLEGFRAVWADLDGWHVEGAPLPGTLPRTTHIWAWHDDSCRWARIRIDGASAVVGLLTCDGGVAPSRDYEWMEEVEFTVAPGVPWGDERQIPPRGESMRHLPFEVAEVRGTAPITFARLVAAS